VEFFAVSLGIRHDKGATSVPDGRPDGGETAGVTDADKLGRSGGIAAHFSSTHSTAVSADAQIA